MNRACISLYDSFMSPRMAMSKPLNRAYSRYSLEAIALLGQHDPCRKD